MAIYVVYNNYNALVVLILFLRYLTIDGEECSSPLPIDAAIYQDLSVFVPKFDMRRPATISGLCSGPSANQTFASGRHTVELFVDRCDGNDQDFQVITGYNSVSRFIIEEVTAEASSCARV